MSAIKNEFSRWQKQKTEAETVASMWHSIKRNVYHDNTECNAGNNIEVENRRTGNGGKKLCEECKKLKRK